MFTAWVNVRLATKVGLVSVFLFFFSLQDFGSGKKGRSHKESRSGLDAQKPCAHLGTKLQLQMRERSFFGVSSVDVCSFD